MQQYVLVECTKSCLISTITFSEDSQNDMQQHIAQIVLTARVHRNPVRRRRLSERDIACCLEGP